MKKCLVILLFIGYNAFCQNFGDFASGIKINNTIYNTTASAQIHQIDPNSGAFFFNGANLGNFGEHTNCSKITGGELKTFKNASANVCSANLFWRVYPSSSSPSGAFSVIPLNTISNCNLSASPVVFFDNLGPCSTRDQKWKDYSIAINFTQGLTIGNYIIEIYFNYSGSNTSTSTCETTKFINNGGNNFKANFSIVKPSTAPSLSQPSVCEGDSLNLNANVSNGVAPFNYNWSGPNGYTSSDASPVISNITLAQAGAYSVVITDSCGSTSTIQSTPNLIVIAKTTPLFTFGTSLLICKDDHVPILVTTSSNNYTGNWNPSTVDTTQNGVYNFISDIGQCANNTSFTVNVTQPTVSTFNPIPAFCKDTTAPTLPLTSNQGYTGNWSPPLIDNEQSQTYIFTPDAGQCASQGTITITVFNPNITPTFALGTSITSCASNTQINLPLSSQNGVNGTWNPSVLDYSIIGTTIYTFTPNAGQCAVSSTLTANVTSNITPTFAIGTSITSCAGLSPQVLLPTTSDNGITGTWNPSTLDYSIVGTTVHTFTPTAGICATTAILTAVINPNITPTFTQVLPICSGGLLNALPTNSIEGITGSWLPALNNLATTIYTFTPSAGLCALTTTMTIVVNPNITPTFNAIATLCPGETPPSLTSPSIEGITGSWTPEVISNTTSGTYIFVPNPGQCATNGNLSITVQDAFDFAISGNCEENNFILEVKSTDNSIDLTTADFIWLNANNEVIGTNSNTLNVTEYLASTTVTETLPISFSVRVVSSTGCYKIEPITLTRIFCGIQKGISVNNDGLNDYFDLTLLNVKHLSIFNRYGMKVYSKDGYTNEWVGQSDKGDDLPDGTYYYVIDFNDNLPVKTGWIYINREN